MQCTISCVFDKYTNRNANTTRCIFTGRYKLELFLWDQPNGVSSWSLHCLDWASQEKTRLTFTQLHITVAVQLIRLTLQSVSLTEALAEICRWSLGAAGWLPTAPSGSVKFREPVSLHYTLCDCMWYITTSSSFFHTWKPFSCFNHSLILWPLRWSSWGYGLKGTLAAVMRCKCCLSLSPPRSWRSARLNQQQSSGHKLASGCFDSFMSNCSF